MSSAKNMYKTFRSSDGRVQLATLGGIGVLATLLVLVFAVLPASAGSGGPSGAGVQPVELSYGGGSGACSANFPGRLPSAAPHELHINNPASGTYTGPDGTTVTITVDPDSSDTVFDYEINSPLMAAFDVVVNGGSQNTHFDYDSDITGPLGADTGLHAPTRGGGNRLYKLSHINICYDVNPITDLSVTKTPVGGGSASEGDPVTFAIVVLNSPESNTTATGVTVVDTIPAGMTFDSADPIGTPGVDAEGNSTYTWSVQDLDPGESATLLITLTIDEGTGGQDLTNSVSVSGDQTDPDPDDDDADSVPPVTVDAQLSGTVFVDSDASSSLDPDEQGEAVAVTVYDSDDNLVVLPLPQTNPQTPSADGTYSFELAPDTYTVCLQQRSTHEQTVPDLPPEGIGVDCSALGQHEKVGYSVDLSSNQSGIDFGNLVLFECDVEKDVDGLTIDGSFEIFTNSNYICGDKGTSFEVVTIEVDGENVEVVKLLLDGGGTAAARGVITKSEASPADFVPLTYSPEEDGTFVTLPWCNVRDKIGADGPQFDTDLGNTGTDDKYPDLTGVEDSPGVPSISCKVTEFQDILGNQITVVFGEFLDPFYR